MDISLSGIKGIGPQTARTLLRHFKSVKRIREATIPEVAKLIGPAKAKLVKTALQAAQPDKQPEPSAPAPETES